MGPPLKRWGEGGREGSAGRGKVKAHYLGKKGVKKQNKDPQKKGYTSMDDSAEKYGPREGNRTMKKKTAKRKKIGGVEKVRASVRADLGLQDLESSCLRGHQRKKHSALVGERETDKQKKKRCYPATNQPIKQQMGNYRHSRNRSHNGRQKLNQNRRTFPAMKGRPNPRQRSVQGG